MVVPNQTPKPLELWGGIEGSVIRVGGIWRDQVRETGHHRRPKDLDRIAASGIRTVRYPVLWERCAPGPAYAGWRWHDRRLGQMRRLGIDPIVGLIHHGSGPAGTNPLDPAWMDGLASHAAAVAARYPWVRRWTPVNEPLTTARFAAAYGHWFPHTTDCGSFHRMLFIQCRAVLLSMRAIRKHIPDAQLVQTEDIGQVFATPPLQHQADHDNARRWLSLDLLCGRVDRSHPGWDAFIGIGAFPDEIEDFAGGEARPDILGVNHYVTSDRFLDHRTQRYPASLHGSNGRDSYVDTEAARVDLPLHLTGWEPRLREVWRRYRLPIAVTEAHLACVDDREPVRWLMEAWRAAQALRAEGADIRAVTAWSLFGACDWDSMVREDRGHYEPGVWDVSAATPEPTRLADAVASLARTGDYRHPILDELGWWRRPDRVPSRPRQPAQSTWPIRPAPDASITSRSNPSAMPLPAGIP